MTQGLVDNQMIKLENKLRELGYTKVDDNEYRKKVFSCIYIYIYTNTLDFYINHWHHTIKEELDIDKLYFALKQAKHDVEVIKKHGKI